MPGKCVKRVRFAHNNTFHSPPKAYSPPLPFPASNVPSCIGPITPPSIYGLPGPSALYVVSSSSYPSFMPHSDSSSSRHLGYVLPHRYLEMFAVTWDLMDHPSTIARKHYAISSRALCQPATNPPLRFIMIISPYLPWRIQVRLSNGPFVTLEDVFYSIYLSLRMNITQQEFNSFLSEEGKRYATHAYEQRYRRQRVTRIYEEEKRGGMKHIDFLRGRTHFCGISNTGCQLHEWQLNVT